MDSHESLGHTEVTLQIDGLPESEVRLSEKCTRLLRRYSAMRVGMRTGAARTSRFERLRS